MKKLCSLGLAILLIFSAGFSASAASVVVPYDNYTYSADGSVIVSPQAYLPQEIIYGHDLGIDNFTAATDIDCDTDGNLYILDTGANKVVVINPDLTLNRVINVAQTLSDGREIVLADARGITVANNKIYICDSENSRMLVLDMNGKYIEEITTPESRALDDSFIYKPVKASIDHEGNYYIVSNGAYEGIVNLSADGEFLGFFAANEATASAWELFWRRFSSVEQRKKSIQFVPQDLSSIDMDETGFFLITSATIQDTSMVKRVNPGGNNVIRALSLNLQGDTSGDSSFTDISSGKYKIYACLDSTRGKIFCYSNDGYLLYTFGAIAEQVGGFQTPSAITYLGDERIAVLDSKLNSVTVFKPTDYAKKINEAVRLNNELLYEESIDEWQEVLKYNQNFEFAQTMIGNSYYTKGDYKTAMYYFEKSHNKEMYSLAKKALRTEWLRNNIIYIIIGVVVLIVLVFVFKFIKRRRKSVKKSEL